MPHETVSPQVLTALPHSLPAQAAALFGMQTHDPPWQTAFAAHALPQEPQCCRLVCEFRHVVPQQTSPPPHVHWLCPPHPSSMAPQKLAGQVPPGWQHALSKQTRLPVQHVPLQHPGAGHVAAGPFGRLVIPHCPPAQVACVHDGGAGQSLGWRQRRHWPSAQTFGAEQLLPGSPFGLSTRTQAPP